MKAHLLLMDIPWPYDGAPDKDAAAAKHYNLMTLEDLEALPIRDALTDNGAVLMWTTGPMMAMATALLAKWGLHYRNVAYVWVKVNAEGEVIKGQGPPPTYTKQNAEYVLFATVEDPVEYVLLATKKRRGRPFQLHDFAQAQVILRRRGAHSAKPKIFHKKIEKIAGPDTIKVEMFAREEREGWITLGDELDGKDIRVSLPELIKL